jgi:hypothetical protein
LFLLEIFQGPDQISNGEAVGASEQFFGENSRSLMFLKKTEYVILNLLQPMLFHVSPFSNKAGDGELCARWRRASNSDPILVTRKNSFVVN